MNLVVHYRKGNDKSMNQIHKYYIEKSQIFTKNYGILH